MPRRPRTAPSYLTRDEARGVWDLRFRYADSIGRVHWPRERSPYPADLARSRQWAAWRRAEIIREIEAEILRVEEAHAAPVTLAQVLDAYAADCRERGTRWEGNEAYRARTIRDTLGAETPAVELTAGRVAAWRTELREQRQLGPRSCNAHVNIIRAALNLAVERELLGENPMRRLRNLPEPLRQPPALSERQVGAVLAACHVWQRWERLPREDRRRQYLPIVTRVMLGYYTGGRPEAIDALLWRNVELARGLIVFPETKGHRNVVCPLDPVLAAHLREAYAARRPKPDSPVLVAPRTGTRADNWRYVWRRLLRVANHRLEAGERHAAPRPPPLSHHPSARRRRVRSGRRAGHGHEPDDAPAPLRARRRREPRARARACPAAPGAGGDRSVCPGAKRGAQIGTSVETVAGRRTAQAPEPQAS